VARSATLQILERFRLRSTAQRAETPQLTHAAIADGPRAAAPRDKNIARWRPSKFSLRPVTNSKPHRAKSEIFQSCLYYHYYTCYVTSALRFHVTLFADVELTSRARSDHQWHSAQLSLKEYYNTHSAPRKYIRNIKKDVHGYGLGICTQRWTLR
jgi:hypothetical protein